MSAALGRGLGGGWRGLPIGLFALWMVLLLPLDSAAHIGGIIVRPTFFTPPSGIAPIEGVVTVSWNDPDEDPTGVLHFYVTPHSLPPTGYLSTTFFEGAEKIGEFPVNDPVDGFDWDTSDFAPGVYTLYAVSVDPPLCNTVTTSPTTMVLRDPSGSAPAPLAGAWVAPASGFTGSIAGKTTLRLEALSTAQPNVTIEVGRIEPVVEGPADAECSAVGIFKPRATVVSDLAGEPDPSSGGDRWTFSTLWDSDVMLPGLHVFKAEFTNTAGQSYTLFSPVEVPVAGSIPTGSEPEMGADVGPSPGDETSQAPDAATSDVQQGGNDTTTLVTVPVSAESGCSTSSRMVQRTAWPGIVAWLCATLWWVARRRRGDTY